MMPLPDDHIDDLLPAWLNGTLTFDVKARVRSHLDHCPTCRAELDEWQAIAQATRAFADARLVTEGQDSGGTRATSQSSGGFINANNRSGDLAERPAEEPRRSRSAMMIDTVSTSTTSTFLASPNGQATPHHQVARRSGVWVSQVLPTLVMMALLVALVGGVYLREFGLPTNFGGGDSHRAPAFSASQDGFSCDSPGSRPVVNGEVDENALAAIGMTETPLNITGDYVYIPTSTGEIVSLPSSWTPIGGPMWASTSGTIPATIQNIETGEEWTAPVTNVVAGGMYFPPYLVLPENQVPTDFRIIDTETDEEILVSELRGGEFTGPTYISQIGTDYDAPIWPVPAPVVLLFTQEASQPMVGIGDAHTDTGPNVLILPPGLADATFTPDTAYARYFHETAYAPATDQLAYSTDINGQPAIVVIEPGTDSRIVLEHPDFTTDAQPLMFSPDGSQLVATQPGKIFTFEINGTEASDTTLLSVIEENVVPIAHNAESMNILVQYPDKHIAIFNAITGDRADFPAVITPESEFPSSGPAQRLSFESDIHELFDNATGTVRFVNLREKTITPELQVMNPEADTISSPFQPQFQYIVRYPFTPWFGGYAYLDVSGMLEVVPTDSSGESWTAPRPANFTLGENEVARLFTNPEGSCIVMQVATAVDIEGGSARSEFVATWVLPLVPGAEWKELDVQLTGWFPIAEQPEPLALPALDYGTPVATPGSTPVSTDARMRRATECWHRTSRGDIGIRCRRGGPVGCRRLPRRRRRGPSG
jgi:hypothetical protein